MSQSTYSVTADTGFAGMSAESDAPKRIRSYALESGTTEYGRGVVPGTNDDEFALPSATGFELLGVTLFNHTNDNRSLTASDGIDAQQTTDIMSRGAVWVLPEQAVVPGDPVFVRHTTNGGDTPGGFRMDADTANADQVTGAKWLTTGDASTPAIVELNLP
jgi:hypothetical protein